MEIYFLSKSITNFICSTWKIYSSPTVKYYTVLSFVIKLNIRISAGQKIKHLILYIQIKSYYTVLNI